MLQDAFARRASIVARQNGGDSKQSKKPAHGKQDDTLNFVSPVAVFGNHGMHLAMSQREDSPVPMFPAKTEKAADGLAIGTADKTTGVIQSEPRKRKPNFSSRTETSCLTCRKRKKRCDEAKPECKCSLPGWACQADKLQVAIVSVEDSFAKGTRLSEERGRSPGTNHRRSTSSQRVSRPT